MTARGASAPAGDGDTDWRFRLAAPVGGTDAQALLAGLPPEIAGSGAASGGLLPLLALIFHEVRPRSILLVGSVDPAVAAFYREAARTLGIPAKIRVRRDPAAEIVDIPPADVELLHLAPDAAALPAERWARLLTRTATIVSEAPGGPGVGLEVAGGVSVAGAGARTLLAAQGSTGMLGQALQDQGRTLVERSRDRPTSTTDVGQTGAVAGPGRLARLWGFAWRSRGHRAVIEPLRDVDRPAPHDGCFRSTGPEPLLALTFPAGRRPTGWVVAELWIAESDAPLCPALLAVAANGARSAYYFSVTQGGRSSRLLRLPDDTVALQLHPSNQPTRFRLERLTLREVGAAQILLGAIRRNPAAVLRTAGHLWKRRNSAAKQEILRCYAGEQAESYADWIALFDDLSPFDRAAIAGHIDRLADRPGFSLLVWLDGPLAGSTAEPAALADTLGSVRAQLYAQWELLLIGGADLAPDLSQAAEAAAADEPRIRVLRSGAALDQTAGDFCGRIVAGDRLAPTALYHAAVHLGAEPDTDLLYGDEDCIDGTGRRSAPWFKTAWDEERFLAQDYVSRLGLFRRSLAQEAGGLDPAFAQDAVYELLLRIVALSAPSRIAHLPHVLYHRRVDGGAALPAMGVAARRAATACLDRRHPGARVEAGPLPTWPRIRWPLPASPPTVTLIVPTRDRVGLVKACLQGLLHETDYPALEVIVVDNDSREADTLAYFDAIVADPRVRVLKAPGAFNFSALNNRAVEQARGAYVGFINNDIEIIEPGWLGEMMSHAVRPGVGSVGAKLLYADGRVQHGGVVLGIGGVAGHTERFAAGDAPGYGGDLMITRNVSCVTAACQIMARSIFEEIGGFDETLTVALNDVDLCVRIVAAGYRILWTPHARLLHLESVSRGNDQSPEKAQRFRQERAYVARRWGAFLAADRFYSPNLTVLTEDMALAFPPRLRRPWLGRS